MPDPVAPHPGADHPVAPQPVAPWPAATGPADRTGRAAEVAALVLAHPGVVALDGGPFGTVATHLPGRRRILGVRIGVGDEPVELAVVALLGIPLPALAEELGAAVRARLGPVPVEVTVSDVAPATTAPAAAGPARPQDRRRP